MDFRIRSVPDDTARAFKALAAQRGLTMGQLLVQLVREAVA